MLRFRGIVAAAMAIGFFAQADGAEPRPLFNGKDLDGWVAEGANIAADGGAVWSVKDGMLHCAGKGFGFLRYDRREFADFTFHVEFRLTPKCNSGIGVRTGAFDPKKSSATRPSMYSYEIQLTDDSGKKPDVHSTGSLYRYIAPRESAVKPAGEWNTIEVTCVGPKIKVVLNGVEVIDADQSTNDKLKDKPLKGNVCLQNHGGTIDFRNVSITEIEAKSE